MDKIKKLYTIFIISGCLVLSLTSCDSFLDIQPVGKVIPNTLEEYRALITTAYGVDLTDRGMCDMRTEDISVSKDEFDHVYGRCSRGIRRARLVYGASDRLCDREGAGTCARQAACVRADA